MVLTIKMALVQSIRKYYLLLSIQIFCLNNPDFIFTRTRHKNWKNAMSSKRFSKYDSCEEYKNCCQT